MDFVLGEGTKNRQCGTILRIISKLIMLHISGETTLHSLLWVCEHVGQFAIPDPDDFVCRPIVCG